MLLSYHNYCNKSILANQINIYEKDFNNDSLIAGDV